MLFFRNFRGYIEVILEDEDLMRYVFNNILMCLEEMIFLSFFWGGGR